MEEYRRVKDDEKEKKEKTQVRDEWRTEKEGKTKEKE